MASIRTVAQNVLSEAKDGISWIALWKEGKGWNAESFWFDYDERTNRFAPAEDYEDIESLREILKTDRNAILVNGYYFNLGDTSCMTRESLADALRWQYSLGNALISDALISLDPQAEQPTHIDPEGAKTRTWKVYGGYGGHRQRQSFKPSQEYDFTDERHGVRIISIMNSDITGTNEYSIVRITRNTADECQRELESMLSDGAFEDCKYGRVEEVYDCQDTPPTTERRH